MQNLSPSPYIILTLPFLLVFHCLVALTLSISSSQVRKGSTGGPVSYGGQHLSGSTEMGRYMVSTQFEHMAWRTILPSSDTCKFCANSEVLSQQTPTMLITVKLQTSSFYSNLAANVNIQNFIKMKQKRNQTIIIFIPNSMLTDLKQL